MVQSYHDAKKQEHHKETLRNLAPLAELVHTEIEPSDKIGYDYSVTYLGDVCIKREYVESAEQTGTAQHPYAWAIGAQLIPNAYYTYDGDRFVYMGKPKVAAAADYPDDNNFTDWAMF